MNKLHTQGDISILAYPRIEKKQTSMTQHRNDYFGIETLSDRFWFYGTYSISLIIIMFIIIILNL